MIVFFEAAYISAAASQLVSSQPAVFFNFFPACRFYIGQQRFETFGEGFE